VYRKEIENKIEGLDSMIRRSPSIEMMVKRLHLKKVDATALKAEMKRGNAERVLDMANSMIGGYGVESVQHEVLWINKYGPAGLLYINKGEPYLVTLCYDTEKEVMFVGSWGDWYDTHKEIQKFRRKQGW